MVIGWLSSKCILLAEEIARQLCLGRSMLVRQTRYGFEQRSQVDTILLMSNQRVFIKDEQQCGTEGKRESYVSQPNRLHPEVCNAQQWLTCGKR